MDGSTGKKKTAVVVGAGPAGLTAARELLDKGGSEWKIVVLEASPHVGGISRTAVHGDCRIDIGGHRFFSKSEEVNALWSKLMPVQGAPSKDDALLGRACRTEAGGPDPETSDRVMLRRHRVSRIYYLRHFFDYPISIKPATFLAMGLVRTWKAGWSYLCSAFRKRPEKSLEDFYVNRFGKVLYSMFFEDYTEKLWGIHPSNISPEWGAQRVKGLSLWKALLNVFVPKGGKRETSLIEEFLYPKKGPGQLWEALADDLRRQNVEMRMNAEVVGVSAEGGRVTAVTLDGGEKIPCDALFSSMPVKDLVAAMGGAPADVARVAEGLPYRDFITVGLLVDRLALGNTTAFKTVNDIIPDTWIYVQERDVRMGRIQVFNNWSPYMVDDVTKHVWIGLEYFCAEGDRLWTMSDEDFIAMATAELRHVGVLGEHEPVRDAVRIRVKKAYPAYFGTYAEFGKVRAWLDGFANLYCIGRNGQHRYNNMDHSMLCGMEAARALLGLSDKAALWDVNTEKEYHETKR
ncbi:MAG: NAD(P)/FAD-dependent oxidoreductase [Kiritimatiellae bacterium]|nr:NAD(P)/FAD-dependent oxidoreductase [Kiritimatiellia bacterium]